MEKNTEPKRVAVVMAGGYGARLWPRSTEKMSKQFIHLLGEGTMIQNTINRVSKIFDMEDIYIVTIKKMVNHIKKQLPDLPEENIIVEPFIRNTAPCLALSAVILSRKYGPDTVMAVFPSDHIIFNKGEFYQAVNIACDAAGQTNGIVTIGIQPTRPEKSFGYIQFKRNKREDLGELYSQGVRYSTTFAEKPDTATAKRFIDSGDFLWNSGIFVWTFQTFWDSMDKHWPEDTAIFKILHDHVGKDSFNANVEQTYKQVTSLSIDYALLEKADNVFVVQSFFRWSDMGNWDELYRLSMKDARNNVIEGDVIPVNSHNCLVSAKGKLIGLVGVKDLIVIDTDDAMLICKRGQSDDVLEVVDFLRRKKISSLL